MSLTVEGLHESASRITGLSDFGDADYLDGLQLLVESYLDEAQLTELGRKVMRSFLRSALTARLLSEAAWRQHPSFVDVPITRPIFVTGLPRTGTTALHRLLAADPAHQGVELWLTDVPQPRPPRSTWESNPIFVAIQDAYGKRSDLDSVHYVAADQVEECWYLLRQSMMSVSFECMAHIPSYSRWLQNQDWVPAYRRHRRNLQLIGLPDAQRRWVLKNPSHLFALDALLEVHPDALVIQTHRDPVTAIASVCSLNARASHGWSDLFAGEVVGRTQLDLWARGLQRFQSERSRHDPAQFLDVQYDDLVADPMRIVEDIYARLGAPLTSEARAAMTALDAPAGHAPSHRYSLADFGLTPAEVSARFT